MREERSVREKEKWREDTEQGPWKGGRGELERGCGGEESEETEKRQ